MFNHKCFLQICTIRVFIFYRLADSLCASSSLKFMAGLGRGLWLACEVPCIPDHWGVGHPWALAAPPLLGAARLWMSKASHLWMLEETHLWTLEPLEPAPS